MKAMIPLAFLMTSVAAWAETPTKADAAVSEFRGSFATYQTSLKDAASSTEPVVDKDDRDLVKLETFSVVGSIARQDLEKAIRDHSEEQAKTEIERSFSWKRGGLIASKKIGTMTADLGLWPKVESSFQSGADGAKSILMLRVDLLHVRW